MPRILLLSDCLTEDMVKLNPESSLLLSASLTSLLVLGAALEPRSTLEQYPIAKHSVPLYPPPIPAIGKFQADVHVGGQPLRMILDTGSSDTWFVTDTTECIESATLKPFKGGKCGYGGPQFKQPGKFKPITDLHFNTTYGNGNSINGPMGHSSVTIGDLKIEKQQVAKAKYVAADQEGKASGIMGLAYPAETYCYRGTNLSADVVCNPERPNCNRQYYSSVMTTLFADHITKPLFAFALSRSRSSGGIWTLGGIPNLQNAKVNASTTSQVTIPNRLINGTEVRLWYMADVDSVIYPGGSSTAAKGQYIVDTGSSAMILPAAEAKAINALFSPPAVKMSGGYLVYCNATAPNIQIQLGGKGFGVNPSDMKLDLGDNSGICISAVQEVTGTALPLILGNPWLKNVLAVFDVGKSEMNFASRMYYAD